MGKHVIKRRYWTEKEDRYIHLHYPDGNTTDIAAKLKRTKSAVWMRARQLGITKSDSFLAEQGRHLSTSRKSIESRFSGGYVPFNKGKREWQFRSRETIEKCAQTRFKAGHTPHNARPEGYESVHSDGYIYIKTGGRKMVPKHIHVWTQHNGPIPNGYIVTFIDGNHANCDIDNLRLMSRADALRLLASRRTPERQAEIDIKRNATRNENIRKDKMRIRWGLPTKGKLVKHWHAPEH